MMMTRAFRGLTLLALLLGLVQCGATGYQPVVVTLDSSMVATSPVAQYLMNSALDGAPSKGGTQTVDLNQVPFTLLVPRGSAGTLSVTVTGLSATGAELAQGTNTVALDGDKGGTLVVTLMPVVPDGTKLSFTTPEFYGSQVSPPLLAADLNGDGRPELLSVDMMYTNVLVLANQGGGVFAGQASTVNPNQGVQTLAVGDVNGDKKPDLLVAEAEGGSLALQLGNGDGTFQAARVLASLSGQGRILGLVDLNNDKALDLVLGYRSGVTVMMGKGDGSFAGRVDNELGLSVNAAAIGDLDNNGVPDLALVHSAGVRVMGGVGDGTFTNGKDGKDLTAVASGFDNIVISDLDLVLANNRQSSFTVLAGHGDGTFRVSQTLKSTTMAAAGLLAADVNNDRKPDVLFLDNSGGQVQVALGNGDGTYQAGRPFPIGNLPTTLAAADFDGDGLIDLAAIAFQEGSLSRVSVIRNTSSVSK